MKQTIIPFASILVLWTLAASAGSLQIGEPTVESELVTFPVTLSGDVGQGVSAIDFRLRYDPAVLEPVEVGAGSAASSADKLVQSNVPKPGECVVVVMGMNQTTVNGGEVARITMKRTGKAQGSSAVSVARTTLAASDGKVIPSEGGERLLAFGDSTEELKPTVTEEASKQPQAVVATGQQDAKPDAARAPVGQAVSEAALASPGLNQARSDVERKPGTVGAEPLRETRRVKARADSPETRQKITAALADAAKKRYERIQHAKAGSAGADASQGQAESEKRGVVEAGAQTGVASPVQGAVAANSNTDSLQVESGDSGNRADDPVKSAAPGGAAEESGSAVWWVVGAMALAILGGIAMAIIKRRSNP